MISSTCKAWCGTTELNSIPAKDAAAWWYGVAGSYVCSPECVGRRPRTDAGAVAEVLDRLADLYVRKGGA